MTDEAQETIECPDCASTNWYCWDERTFPCWDKDGYHCGDKVVGYLRCRDCDKAFMHTSVDDSDDACECEED